jgi:hypothetical protein
MESLKLGLGQRQALLILDYGAFAVIAQQMQLKYFHFLFF